MRDRHRFIVDDRLFLPGECRGCLGIRPVVNLDAEPALGDARLHLDREIQRLRSDLLEPETQFLDEVERESVAPVRSGRDDRGLELDRLARLDDEGERRARAVPHDRVAERVEPVVRELHTFSAARAPRRGARVLEAYKGLAGNSRARLVELVRQPANRERPDRYRVLADALHREG